MALVAALTFDFGTTVPTCFSLEDPNQFIQLTTVNNSDGRTKGRANISVAGAAYTYYWGYVLPLALSELYFQFALYIPYAVASEVAFVRWLNGSTVLGGVKITTSRTLDVYTGDFASKVITGTTAIPLTTWTVIELRIKIDDSSGALALRLNMADEGSYSGDTKPGADTTVDRLVISNFVGGSNTIRISDVIIHDTTGAANNSWPNGGRPYRLRPTGDGTTKDWSPSSGSDHYALVDEDTPSSSDYLRAESADLVDELALADLPVAAEAVKGVIFLAQASKGSSSSPNQLQFGLKLDSTDYWQAAANALGTSMAPVREVLNEHPLGGSLAVDDINGAQLLLKSA